MRELGYAHSAPCVVKRVTRPTKREAEAARLRSPTLEDLTLDELTSPIIQEATNLEARKICAVSVVNGWALLLQVLNHYLPDAPRRRVKQALRPARVCAG
jgi:hypothetical protein